MGGSRCRRSTPSGTKNGARKNRGRIQETMPRSKFRKKFCRKDDQDDLPLSLSFFSPEVGRRRPPSVEEMIPCATHHIRNN